MRPRELQVDPINASCTEFRGFPNVREEYVRLFKRPPVFNTRTKSWSAPPAKVTDLAAALESRGWLVTYSRPEVRVVAPVVEADADLHPVETEVSLW